MEYLAVKAGQLKQTHRSESTFTQAVKQPYGEHSGMM